MGVLRALIALAKLLLLGGLVLTIILIGAGAAPSLFGHESFVVYSGSMEPALPVGAIAVVKPEPVSRIRPGDVVTYRTPAQPEMVVTHRVVAVETGEDGQPQLRTKGDANPNEDVVQVDASAVLGKVVYGVPFAGYVVEFTRRPGVRVLLLGVPAVYFVVTWLASAVRRNVSETTTPAVRTAAPADLTAAPAREDQDLSQRNGQPAAAPSSADLERAIERLLPVTPRSDETTGPLAGMVDAARAALARGDAAAAARAAEGILAVDPRNEGAWLIKAETEPDAAARTRLLHTALMVNPGSARLAAALRATQPQP